MFIIQVLDCCFLILLSGCFSPECQTIAFWSTCDVHHPGNKPLLSAVFGRFCYHPSDKPLLSAVFGRFCDHPSGDINRLWWPQSCLDREWGGVQLGGRGLWETGSWQLLPTEATQADWSPTRGGSHSGERERAMGVGGGGDECWPPQVDVNQFDDW